MAELRIYNDIGDAAVSAEEFVRQLDAVGSDVRLDIRINSLGGDVFDAIAIHNAIVRHPARTTVYIDGLAASSASFIAQAGDEIIINRYARVMIHDAWTITIGDAADHSASLHVLDSLGDTIAQIYADNAGGTAAQWRDRMRAETWYTASQAVEAGLAHRIDDPDRTRAMAVAAARRNRNRLTTSTKG